jgi:hypothetical protein
MFHILGSMKDLWNINENYSTTLFFFSFQKVSSQCRKVFLYSISDSTNYEIQNDIIQNDDIFTFLRFRTLSFAAVTVTTR